LNNEIVNNCVYQQIVLCLPQITNVLKDMRKKHKCTDVEVTDHPNRIFVQQYDSMSVAGMITHLDSHTTAGAVIWNITGDNNEGHLYVCRKYGSSKTNIIMKALDATAILPAWYHGVTCCERLHERITISFFY
jgi:hypothetical protein